MTLMRSRQPKTYRWQKGDLISASEACEILGYKSPRNLQDKKRRGAIKEKFEEIGCELTTDIFVGGELRFLRSEIDEYLTATVEAAQNPVDKRRGGGQLRLAA